MDGSPSSTGDIRVPGILYNYVYIYDCICICICIRICICICIYIGICIRICMYIYICIYIYTYIYIYVCMKVNKHMGMDQSWAETSPHAPSSIPFNPSFSIF